MRVWLDTNVLVAAFATRGLCTDVLRTVLAEHELVHGDVIIAEFRRVLQRKLRLPGDRIDAAEAVFDGIARVSKPKKPSSLKFRDPADKWIVATAMTGKADVLVTGDTDLLAVAAVAPLRIVTPREFWEILRSES